MVELLYDCEFGLSGGEISGEESKDAYCYRVKACLTKKSLEIRIISDSCCFSLDKPENKSEGATRVTFHRYIRLDKLDNTVSNIKTANFPRLLAVTGTLNFSSFIPKTNVHFSCCIMFMLSSFQCIAHNYLKLL